MKTEGVAVRFHSNTSWSFWFVETIRNLLTKKNFAEHRSDDICLKIPKPLASDIMILKNIGFDAQVQCC